MLISSITFLQINPSYVNAEEKTDSNVVEVENTKELNKIEDEEGVIVKKNNLDKINKEELQEVLDDGVKVIVKGDCQDVVADYFDDRVRDDCIGKNYALLGYEVNANADDYECTPISATFALEEGESIDDYDINELKKEIKLEEQDVEECLKSDDLVSKDVLNEKISNSEKANLQASNPTGRAYTDAFDKSFVYRKSFWNNQTAVTSRTSQAKSGWAKIGTFKLWTYVINAGTARNRKQTFDAVYTVAQVSGQGGRWIQDFTVQNRLYKDGRYAQICDASYLKGGNSTKTVSIGLSVEGSKTGLSGGFNAGFSYSYDPCDSKINNQLGDDYVQHWKCTPNDPEGNESYKLCPMILVRNTNGTNRTTTVSIRVWEARIRGKYGNYYVDNKWGEHYVCIKFKNHRRVC